MHIYNEQDFIDIIRKDITPLSKDDFFKTTRLGKLWDKLDADDVRVKTLQSKDNFYQYCYDFIHSDDPLILYFNRRFKYKKPSFNIQILPIDDTIDNKPNNVRFLRNINLKSMLDTTKFDDSSIINIYRNALENGIVSAAFTAPSVFQTAVEDDYESYVVTLKTISGQASIFSPQVYKSLVHKLNEYYTADKKQKILIPTASWGSPVIALESSSLYSDMHIVDVQQDVLDTCHELFNFIHNDTIFNTFFETEYPTLKTFCTPSEKMTSVVDNDYDKIFFCPPYYDLELYGGSDYQSTTMYDTYDDWLVGYWEKTVQESYKVLKNNGIFSFVIGKNVRGYNMGDDLSNIALKYFEYITEIKIMPPVESTRKSTKGDEKYEICYIMKK